MNVDGDSDCICRYNSLEEALRDMDNNTFVNITTFHAILPSPVTVTNLNNITIAGHNYPTVDCNHTGSFVCKDCNSIIINHIKWMKCIESYPCNPQDSGGLHFDACINLTIQLSTFVASSIQVVSASGIINVENVEFSGNLISAYSPVYCHEYNYGGLLVEQFNAAMLKVSIINSSFTNASPIAQLLTINAAVVSMLISNARFVNSINTQPVPSIYGNSMAFINVSSEGSNLTISNSTFLSNTVAENGSILSVLLNENDSTIQIQSCMFLNNTASNIAFFKTRNLTIINSTFEFNNGEHNLISIQSQISLVTDLNELIFLSNTGGPLLSLNSHNISNSFTESIIEHNTLFSGHGLVAVLDYYTLDVLLDGIKFLYNDITGNVLHCSSLVGNTTYDSVNITANAILINVLFQSNTATGDILSLIVNGDDSTIQLQHSIFHNNTSSGIAVTILNSNFTFNNKYSNLIVIKNHALIVANLTKLMFSNNEGGPLLSLNSHNISTSFTESIIENNNLFSGHGLVAVLDYYTLDVLLDGIKFLYNDIAGSVFHCSNLDSVDITSAHANALLINVLFQSNNATGDILSLIVNGDDSTIQLQHSIFHNNTSSGIAVTILNSNFTFNNKYSNLIVIKNHALLVANLTKLMFSNNEGGPLLSLNSHNISTSFTESIIENNTLFSGHGLVAVLDHYTLDVLLDGIKFLYNDIAGSVFRCSSLVGNITSDSVNITSTHANAILINVLFQSNNATGDILSLIVNGDDSTIQLQHSIFHNNTSSGIAVTILNSNFTFNNKYSNLIAIKNHALLVANLTKLMFSNNEGGPLLSLNSHNISTSFTESIIENNTLFSGHGLVAVLDHYALDVLLDGIKFLYNDIAGSVFHCSSLVGNITSDSVNITSTHANAILINVLFQSNNATGDILSLIVNGDDSTIQLQHSIFHNNTSPGIAVTILNSNFTFNNKYSNLIVIKNHALLAANLTKLMFSNNEGGPLLSLNSNNIIVDLGESKMLDNTLVSGHGLVIFQDYYNLYAILSGIQFVSNNMLTEGSAFYCSSSVVNTTINCTELALLIMQNVEVLRQHGNGHGAGVYISHQSCDGSYTIKQCTFGNTSNINSVIYFNSSNYSQYSTNLLIQNCTFINNSGTALYLVNSNLKFEKGLTLFENNTAEHGAALYLDLNSKIIFGLHSEILFSKNEARRYGGAIFCSVSVDSDCYKNISDALLVLNDDNEMIQFKGNAAGAGGDSVYFNVQQSCDEQFQSISNIMQHSFSKQMVTSPNELQLYSPASLINYTNVTEFMNSTNPTYLVPNIMRGQDITVPSCLLDYNKKPAGVASFLISHIQGTGEQYLLNGRKSLSIGCPSLQGISNLRITGNQSSNRTSNSYHFKVIDNKELKNITFDNDFTTIQLNSFYDTTYTLKPIVVNLIIELSANCHAGFHYNQDKCVCYTTDDVISCAGSNATVRRGYWFGTVNKQATVSFCPVNYCNFDRCEATTTFCPLSPSIDDQCSSHRSGAACGNCKNGYTLSFDSVDCVDINKCTAGYITLIVTMTILYWILTIVMVFVVMYFKVGIGYFYSLTFYYSVIDILLGQALHTSDALNQMVTILSSLARLTPQFLGQLCFVKELSGIDQQYIHYIHPLAVLFILLLLSMSARFSPRFSLFVSRGVIHVICFLMLLSYTSIASTSLLLMRPLTFTGIDKTYTYLSPEIEYFRGRHLVYGLVAMACGVMIVIGFPLLLLLEPFLNRKLNFARIKPLLDQFQGHYKDNYRYFASYYMIGRLVMLIIVNININNVFTVAYLQLGVLVIMTLIHIIVRPYAKNILNVIDGFLLLTTIMVAMIQPFEASNGFATDTVVGLSFFLVLLPLLIFIVVITPYMNKQQIKKFMMFCVSTLKSSKRNETANREIELQPAPNEAYQVTVHQDLRESISTTIV